MSRRRSPDKENRSPGQRQLRVGEEIRHLLADLLERGNMRDPDLRDATITVTSVDVSPDLRNAIAFVMPLGGKDTDRLLSALRRAAPWFRARVSEKAGLRSAPEIRFQLDRTFDEADKIDIRYYSIIYKVTEEIEALMLGLVDPTYKETFLGNAQIREVFRITKTGNVAGCMVTEGIVKRGAKVRLLRDNVVIHEGTLKSLRRFKEEVREVQHGFECGMAFENYDNIKVGDVIECFDVEEVKPTL